MFKFFKKQFEKNDDINLSRRNFLKKSVTTGIGTALIMSPFLSKSANAKISFNNEKIEYSSIKELFFKLSQIRELKPFQNGEYFKLNKKKIQLYKGENPIYNGENIPTIIFIADIHLDRINPDNYNLEEKEKYGSEDHRWTVELKQIELLNKKFGLNLVGLEGWAGDKIDKKRGYKILNGESSLVEYMISRFDYNIIGLENEITQFEGLEMTLSYYFYNFNLKKSLFFSKIDSKKHMDLYLKILEIYLKYSKVFGNFNIINTKIRDIILKEFNNEKSFEFSTFFGGIYPLLSRDLNFIMKKIKQVYNKDKISLNEFVKLNEKLIKKYRPENIPYNLNIQFNSEKRETEAIKNLDKYLVNDNIVIMVFGVNHINGFVEKFKKKFKDKINIYITV